MSILSELLDLSNFRRPAPIKVGFNQSIQTIVKLHSVQIGSLEKVFGEDAATVVELMNAKLTDQIYELKPTCVNAEATKKSLVDQAASSQDDMHLVKLIGRRKLLVWKNRVLTTKEEFDSLVEMTIVPEGLSAKDERDVQNVGRFSRDQALSNGQSRAKAAEISKKAMATRRKNLTK